MQHIMMMGSLYFTIINYTGVHLISFSLLFRIAFIIEP